MLRRSVESAPKADMPGIPEITQLALAAEVIE
jgi:hypothetical protein